MSEPATQLRVKVARERFALDVDVAWDARVAVIFGPSGAGKSTLFEAALGLAPAARGQVCIGGSWLEDDQRGLRLRPEARRLGWVPQDALLFPHLNVAENIAIGAGRAAPPAPGSALARALESLEIGELMYRRAHQLRWRAQRVASRARSPPSRGRCCSTSRSPRSTCRCGPRAAPPVADARDLESRYCGSRKTRRGAGAERSRS